MTEPLVSVVVPAYNAEATIGDAVTSVLAQTWARTEVVVVDDGSTDATAEVAARYGHRVTVVRQVNAGVAAARNAGIAASNGELVAFLDADDLYLPEKIERQVAALTADDRLGCVYTGLHLVDERGRFRGRMRPAPAADALRNTLLLERPLFSAVTGLFPKRVLEELGGFDTRLSTAADCDLAVRVALRYPVLPLDAPLFVYRQHENQMHLDPARTEHDMQLIYAKVFALPELPPGLRRARRRAMANLYVSLAGAHLHRGDLRGFARSLARAARWRPGRIVAGAARLSRPGGPEGLAGQAPIHDVDERRH